MAISFLLAAITVCSSLLARSNSVAINIAFHWHMHQPIYYPGESVVDSIINNRIDGLLDIFTSRTGPYTSWPVDAIQTAQNGDLSHCGAQISFSGSLAENLMALENSNLTRSFDGWTSRWLWAQRNLRTSLGNPKIYLTAFGCALFFLALICSCFM